MVKSFEELCQKLCLPTTLEKYSHYAALQKWCRENISKDISYSGSFQEKYQQYQALAKDYLDYFQYYIQKNQGEKNTPEFAKAAVKYAIERGYEIFLRTQPAIDKSILEEKDYNGTLLHTCAAGGHVSIVNRLLEEGANPRQKDSRGHSPLQDALAFPFFNPQMKTQKEAIYRALLSKAPDLVRERDHAGNTVVHHMARVGYASLIGETLGKHPDLAWVANRNGEYPIHTAILQNQLVIGAYLLGIKGMPAVVDVRNRTPLHFAAYYGTSKMVNICIKAIPQKLFLEVVQRTPKEAQFSEVTENRYILSRTSFWFFDAFKRKLVPIDLPESALDKLHKCFKHRENHEITREEFAAIKKTIVHLVPNYFNARDIDDATPILLAASANNLATLEVLLGYYSCLKKQDIHGFSLLHHAIINENEPMLRMLLSKLPREGVIIESGVWTNKLGGVFC